MKGDGEEGTEEGEEEWKGKEKKERGNKRKKREEGRDKDWERESASARCSFNFQTYQSSSLTKFSSSRPYKVNHAISGQSLTVHSRAPVNNTGLTIKGKISTQERQ